MKPAAQAQGGDAQRRRLAAAEAALDVWEGSIQRRRLNEEP